MDYGPSFLLGLWDQLYHPTDFLTVEISMSLPDAHTDRSSDADSGTTPSKAVFSAAILPHRPHLLHVLAHVPSCHDPFLSSALCP